MIERKRFSSRVFDALNVTLMVLLCIAMIYPLLYELFLSLSVPRALFGFNGFLIWPRGFTLNNYIHVLTNPSILSGLRNTLFILVVGVSINLIMTCLAAYFLARSNTLLFRPVMIMILVTMYFGGGMIPTYLNISDLKLLDTLWALILPGALSTYNVIVLRSFFRTIPPSMVESVEIDGGGHLTLLFRIFVPLSTASMAVILLYYAVGHWNSWFSARIYLRRPELFPLQYVLQKMLVVGSNTDLGIATDPFYEQLSEAIKAATVMVVTVPVLCFYPLLQKYFVGGVMVGSLKG